MHCGADLATLPNSLPMLFGNLNEGSILAFITVAAFSVTAVLNTLGVNTHLDSFNYGYQNLAVTGAAINYLGFKNLRDSAQHSWDLTLWPQVASATGAHFDDYMGQGSRAQDTTDLTFVSALANQGILNFVEGGNENDDACATSQGNSISWTSAFQMQVYSTGHALGLPVINMSFGAGWTALNNWHGNYDKVGDLSPYADYGNAHTYPNLGANTDGTIKMLNADAKLAAWSRPVITTEIGWDTAKFDPVSAARFALDAVFDGIKEGDVKMYFYSLFDDGSGKYGLMNQDGSPKPAGAALHNLTTILADAGAPRSGSLSYSLSGTTANDSTLLMQKSSGTFQLVVWNEIDAAHMVTLALPQSAAKINIYDPITGSVAVQRASNAGTITFRVPDHPVIAEIVPVSP
ncbi:MAG: hypothetical protein JWM91_3464 [Rhodospirillales bacterium]|nr:hypothetical protein [Rhodospirillales bacterium]